MQVDDTVSAGELDREVFRIAIEALQNAARHAHAEHVSVSLGQSDGHLALEVRDDGVGFDPDDPELRSRRLGLTSMEERAERIGANLTIDSAPGRGTAVRLEVPVA
jgi:signal transduction histidine kinase